MIALGVINCEIDARLGRFMELVGLLSVVVFSVTDFSNIADEGEVVATAAANRGEGLLPSSMVGVEGRGGGVIVLVGSGFDPVRNRPVVL